MAVERRTDPHRHRLDWPELLHLLLLALLASLLLPAVASALRPVGVAAAGKSVEWANFDVTLDVHGNGETHVAERQVIDFSGGPWSGGFRDIPMARIDTLNDVTVSQVVGGATRQYQYVPKDQYTERAGTYTYRVSSDDTLMIQWGFPKISNQTLTFLVEYDVDGVIMSYPDATPPYQQLSWIAVDRDLSSVAPVRNASLTMHFPAAIDPAKAQVNPRDDPANHTKDGTTWTWSKANLSSGEVFGAAVRFPPMLSVAPPSWQSSSDTAERDAAAFDQQRAIFNAIAVGLALLLLVLGGIGAYLLWNTQGKDPVVAPIAFLAKPPDDLRPGAAGTLLDEQADEQDLVATLVDLGQRGVLQIEQEQTGGFMGFGQTTDITVRLANAAAPLAPFERELVKAMFGSKLEQGETTHLSTAKQRIGGAVPAIKAALYQELVDRGYFARSPEATRSFWKGIGQGVIVFGLVALFLANSSLPQTMRLFWVPLAVTAFYGLVLMLLSGKLPKKTEAGAEAAAKWSAFRHYLEDIERYQKLDQAQGIFEEYLPYAIAFGIERSWVQKFAGAQPAASGGGWVGVPGGWYGPTGSSGMPSGHGGGTVIIGNPWGNLGPTQAGGGGGNGGSGGWGLPDLQGGSDRTARTLQGTSAGLLGLFNTAGSIFTPSSGSGGGGGFGGGWGGGGGFGGGGGGGGGFGGSGGGGGGFH